MLGRDQSPPSSNRPSPWRRATAARGFTLIELVVVMCIIGILAAIVLRFLHEYRQRAFDSRAMSDLRNAATAEEAYFATNGTYKTGSDVGPGSSSFLPGLMISETVTLKVEADGSYGFIGEASSTSGSRTFTLRYDSTQGGIQ